MKKINNVSSINDLGMDADRYGEGQLLGLFDRIMEDNDMKVFDVSTVYGVYEKKTKINRPVQQSPSSSKLDKLSLSKDAKDYQLVMKGLKEVPDTRAEIVAELAQKYQSGNYSPDMKDVAEGILNSGLFSNKT